MKELLKRVLSVSIAIAVSAILVSVVVGFVVGIGWVIQVVANNSPKIYVGIIIAVAAASVLLAVFFSGKLVWDLSNDVYNAIFKGKYPGLKL